MSQKNAYHLVDLSPWPVLLSLCLLNLTLSIVLYMHGVLTVSLVVAIVGTILTLNGWIRDINSEGAYLGAHTKAVKKGLTLGFLLFVLTEVMFFISIFWAFMHISLSPAIELGTEWPPLGVSAISPWGLPLVNTILLLSSGAFLTIGHHYYVGKDREIAILGFIITIILSILFTSCQLIEFMWAPFTLSDSAFATVFYFGTSFHGIHVVLGTVILVVAGYRIYSYIYTNIHCVGIEGAIVYWHLVDVVWLFLYIVIYWWTYTI